MAAIQRNVRELNKRNFLSRHFHAKNDKDAIAAWKSDLNRILHVFTVRSIVPSLAFLMSRFQVEFAVTTHVVAIDIHRGVENTQNMVSDLHQDVENTQDMVSDLHHDVANTQTMVSSIHRTIVDRHGQAGVGSGNESVSIHFVPSPPITKLNCWLDSSKVCDVGCRRNRS